MPAMHPEALRMHESFVQLHSFGNESNKEIGSVWPQARIQPPDSGAFRARRCGFPTEAMLQVKIDFDCFSLLSFSKRRRGQPFLKQQHQAHTGPVTAALLKH